MPEVLFLPEQKFPDGFPSSRVQAETAVMESVNSHGKNRNIQEVRYIALKEKFPYFRKIDSKFVGAICSFEVLEETESAAYDPYTWREVIDNQVILYRIKCFVVVTGSEIASRNAYIAQSLFPFLFVQLATTNNSPCKILSSLPIYLLCMLPDDISIPPSIQYGVDFLSAAGVLVIAPFRKAPIVSAKALTIEEMAERQFENELQNVFSLDKSSRIFQVDRNGLDRLLSKDGTINGSNEKFGMLKLIPAVLVAKRVGYSLEISAFVDWLRTLEAQSTRHGSKLRNLESVSQFLRKLADGE